MYQLNSSCDFKVVHVAPKMVLFELRPNEYAWASRRIANLIFRGNRDNLFIVQENALTMPMLPENGCCVRECNNFIAIPSTR